MTEKQILAALTEASAGLQALMTNDTALKNIGQAAFIVASSIRGGGGVLSCGNGGSMCDAMHFAEELTGRFRRNRKALRAHAISDPAFLSCTANDFGYEHVFSRYVEAHGRPGDVLLAISTSGTSKNVLLAAEAAKAGGMKVVSLTGKPGSTLGAMADVDVCTPAGHFADRVQELHIKVIHILIELAERQLYPENY